MVSISWLDLYLQSIETFWKASLVQEKLQSADFANFTEVVGKLYEIAFVYKMCPNCFYALRFHSNNRHNSSVGIA